MERMYVWTQPSIFPSNEFSHVFPRPLGGGVIIGGVRLDNDWDGSFDHSRVERIKQRACQLAPELGKPEDLQVVRNNIGLRRKFMHIILVASHTSLDITDSRHHDIASREGGARIDIEDRGGRWLVHNYGAGGSGYQSSW